MSSTIFQFKEFAIDQTHAAMKVGTDAIVLGSWTKIAEANTILDIGTGTGILSLMLAQRSDAEVINAVELDENAYETAVTNFENSPWGDRLFCYHASIQEFAKEMDDTYDVIICNPPYFTHSDQVELTPRKIARTTHSLDFETLLKNTRKLLSENGTFALSLPSESEKNFVATAEKLGFHLQRILHVKDNENAEIVRVFMQLGLEINPLEETVLVLKKEDKSYTDAFKDLTRDFYTIF